MRPDSRDEIPRDRFPQSLSVARRKAIVAATTALAHAGAAGRMAAAGEITSSPSGRPAQAPAVTSGAPRSRRPWTMTPEYRPGGWHCAEGFRFQPRVVPEIVRHDPRERYLERGLQSPRRRPGVRVHRLERRLPLTPVFRALARTSGSGSCRSLAAQAGHHLMGPMASKGIRAFDIEHMF